MERWKLRRWDKTRWVSSIDFQQQT